MQVVDKFVKISTVPVPLRAVLMRKLLTRFPVGSYLSRLAGGAVERPWYGFCLYQAALEAKLLGHSSVTAVELGVAGGNGLICLCKHRDEIEKLLDIQIAILGFDTGAGLPVTTDSRDLLYCWPAQSFRMDRDRLERRLEGRAELIIGDVQQTVSTWSSSSASPLGAVFFDLDFYTSTRDALGLLLKANVLPRTWCYMDDISGYPENAYSDSIGVRAAIREFNLAQDRDILRDHLSQAFVFKGSWPDAWHQQIYIYHRLSHPQYDLCLSRTAHELQLR